MTEQWTRQEAEDFKKKIKGTIEQAIAVAECIQLYGLPKDCDRVAMAKHARRFRKACEALDVTLSAILVEQQRKELEKRTRAVELALHPNKSG